MSFGMAATAIDPPDHDIHLLLASETLTLGRLRSSLSLSLCSVSLRSLSSDMDCLW